LKVGQHLDNILITIRESTHLRLYMSADWIQIRIFGRPQQIREMLGNRVREVVRAYKAWGYT